MANDCIPEPQGQYEPGKLFVGGLNWETKEDTMKAHFKQFGEISLVQVMRQMQNQQPRGFGFVTFVNQEDAERALAHPEHIIDQSRVDPKRATKSGTTTSSSASKSVNLHGSKKVFVGGLPTDATKNNIREALVGFGAILEEEDGVDIKIDRNTERSRGFAFVTFVSEEAASKACSAQYVQVLSKSVEVKVAEERTKGGKGGYGYGTYGGGGGGGGYQPYGQQMTPQQHSGYGYSSSQGGAAYAAGYPQQWPGYEQYQGASGGGAGYYQGSSNPASSYTAAAYGNSYNSSRAEPAGATFSTPQQAQQTYSYPQQQQQPYATGYPGYGGGGAGRSQIQQQGYNSSFPPRQ